jgi:hypothetical protein
MNICNRPSWDFWFTLLRIISTPCLTDSNFKILYEINDFTHFKKLIPAEIKGFTVKLAG